MGNIELKPPRQTAFGPVCVETRLEDSAGRLLAERLYVFGMADVTGPLVGLLKSRAADSDDDVSQGRRRVELPNGPDNLAFVGNGAKPATASSARPEPYHQPQGINDGVYGNAHSWIGTTPRCWFQIDLGKIARIGRFKLGRDRTGSDSTRPLDYLKIETSRDGRSWQLAFEQTGISGLAGFAIHKTIAVRVLPVQARYVRGTVDPVNPAGGVFPCIDEFEVYAPAKDQPLAGSQIEFVDAATIWRPVAEPHWQRRPRRRGSKPTRKFWNWP